MPGEVLIAILILLPFATGLVGLAVRDGSVRRPLIIVPLLVLIGASFMLLFSVLDQGPIIFSPSSVWDVLALIGDFALVAYFLYVGYVRKNTLIGGLGLLQLILLTYLRFGVLPAGFAVERAFYVDLLAVIMALVISVVGALIAIYAIDYMRHHEEHLKPAKTRQPVFFLFLIGLLGAMNGLVFANDLLLLFFFWEITTLCCFQLIGHDLTDEARVSAERALWMNMVGGVSFLAGMILCFQATGTLLVDEVLKFGVVGPAVLLPLALFCFTGFTKAAQVPWQSWLLGAMVAPTPVSALLHSSTMVKAGVYLVLRLAPGYEGTQLSVAIAIFGAFVFMVTAMVAISQRVSKRVLAYSTISNLGLIVCCAGINTNLAIAAAILMIIFHAISKGMLFMAVGIIEQQIGSRDIEDMEGLLARLPVISGTAIIGMISMLFMPFGVVVAKWAGIEAAAVPNSPWFSLIVTMLVIGSAASLVFWTKWIGRMMSHFDFGKAAPSPAERRDFLAYGTVTLLIAAVVVLSVFIGPLVAQLINPAEVGMGYKEAFDTVGSSLKSGFGLLMPLPLFLSVIVALVVPLLLIKVRREEFRPVYLCGANVESDAAAFSSVAEAVVPAATGGLYWEKAFGEKALNTWINVAGVVLLALLFAGVIM